MIRPVQSLSIVIPTLGRERVLLETVGSLLELPTRAAKLFVVDQTPTHEPTTEKQLDDWDRENLIEWIRLERPSITRSMNHGLRLADTPLVLFLDDDIRPRGDLVLEHAREHGEHEDLWATVGQVIQPWQSAEELLPPRRLKGLRKDEDFPFHAVGNWELENVMAGNLCVNRERVLSIGGFDENFVGSAFRFETEFARRVSKASGKIRFLGSAGIDHLRVETGGTRTRGSHLTSASPAHGVGDHYYAMLHANSSIESMTYCIRRVFREVRTKFHMTHPWWIPVKLTGEVRAYFAARRLIRKRDR
ncbi:MAG: glycosyltransferase [Planctomycetota bacterium]